jgi:hypothetical protein
MDPENHQQYSVLELTNQERQMRSKATVFHLSNALDKLTLWDIKYCPVSDHQIHTGQNLKTLLINRSGDKRREKQELCQSLRIESMIDTYW